MKIRVRGTEYSVVVVRDASSIPTSSNVVGVDIETNPNFDLQISDEDRDKHGIDPRLSKIVLAQVSSGDSVYILNSNFGSLRGLLEDRHIKKIIHTASFEYKHFLHHLNVGVRNIVDVEILDGIVDAGRQSRKTSLKDLTKKYLGEDLDKDIRGRFVHGARIDRQMVEYAAKDAAVLSPIYSEQMKMTYPGMDKVTDLEFKLIPSVSRIELVGMNLEEKSWMKVYRKNLSRLEDINRQLCRYDTSPVLRTSMFGSVDSDMNFNSQDQKRRMLEGAGVGDLPDLKSGTLVEYYAKTKHPLVKIFLDYAKYTKSVTTYGEEFLKNINPITGRVHQHIKQVEARTGRLAGRTPNLMNIPKKEKEFRKCFVAGQPYWHDDGRQRKKRVLCVADYSQQELRILAEISGDKKLTEAFEQGIDVHLHVARILFRDKTIGEKDSRRRDAKNFNFGLLYGMGVDKLAKALKVSKSEARELMTVHAQEFSRVFEWTNDIGESAKVNGYVTTLLGRRRYADSDIFDSGTVARNTPIQGTAAEITKLAVLMFDKKINWPDVSILNVVHDELITESYEDVAKDVLDEMIKTMIAAAGVLVKSVPFDAEGYISYRWSSDGE